MKQKENVYVFDSYRTPLERKISAFFHHIENGEKLLVKSEDEYTSPISKIYKVDKEYIIITENSIYLVDNELPYRAISQ